MSVYHQNAEFIPRSLRNNQTLFKTDVSYTPFHGQKKWKKTRVEKNLRIKNIKIKLNSEKFNPLIHKNWTKRTTFKS